MNKSSTITKAPASKEVRRHIASLLEYLWEKELQDFEDVTGQRGSEDEADMHIMHIMHDIVAVHNWLHEDELVAEDLISRDSSEGCNT